MKYQANPVIVEAHKIVGVGPVTPGANGLPLAIDLALEDGTSMQATPEMISRHIPKPDDYLVIQEDGYAYLNPKEVFERKYSPINV